MERGEAHRSKKMGRRRLGDDGRRGGVDELSGGSLSRGGCSSTSKNGAGRGSMGVASGVGLVLKARRARGGMLPRCEERTWGSGGFTMAARIRVQREVRDGATKRARVVSGNGKESGARGGC
jgi:hypothetical protein